MFKPRCVGALSIFTALICATNQIADAVDLVKDSKPAGAIVIPADPIAVESYAAKELQYHIQAASGAQLPIVPEGHDLPPGGHVFLGRCKASAAAGADPSALPGNGYCIQANDKDLFIAGKDAAGDPLDLDTHEGTLFAVYDLLESQLNVRWLWPGKLGEVIPHRADISLNPPAAQIKPLLLFKQWRGGRSTGEKIWLKRQRFGRSARAQYGHSFTKYWPEFNKTHPEFFAMLPDGTRSLDPTSDKDLEYVHMCVSEPGLVKEIIEKWKAAGTPRFLNVCEDDGWAGCCCERCMSSDEPDPNSPIPFDKRLEAAKKVFEGRGDWQLQLGSLSDRYAKFWKAVADEAVKIRPDVEVTSYAYDNYRRPPLKAMLNRNVMLGFVPQESIFGYSKADSAVFRSDWSGWEKTGAVAFLRPNYTLQAQNFPAAWPHTLGEDLKFAMAHGLQGTDFDSLTSKYSTQGPTLYVLAAILNHPDASVDGTLDDFYSAFGPAKSSVKGYFESWESIYPEYSPEEKAARIKSKRKYGTGLYGPYYLLAGDIFTPNTMDAGRKILEKAKKEAAEDPTASARLEWLDKGLTHADLILAAQKAYEQGVDSGDKTEFTKAYKVLTDFREENAEYDKTNFAGLSGDESKWTRTKKKPVGGV